MFSSEELNFFREDQENILLKNLAVATIFRYDPANETFDPETFVRDLGQEEILFQGKMFIQPTTRTYERMFTQGEQRAISRTYIVRVPYPTDNVYIDDTIRVDSCPDIFFVGKLFTIIDVQGSSHSIDRRMMAELNLG